MHTCPVCKYETSEDMSFCNKCGSPINRARIMKNSVSQKTVTIHRKPQFVCAMNSYQVTVDGYTLGKIGVGKTITAQSRQDITTVDIVCTTIMINAKLSLKLSAGPDTRISFKVSYPGSIHATVTGAEIIEQRSS